MKKKQPWKNKDKDQLAEELSCLADISFRLMCIFLSLFGKAQISHIPPNSFPSPILHHQAGMKLILRFPQQFVQTPISILQYLYHNYMHIFSLPPEKLVMIK